MLLNRGWNCYPRNNWGSGCCCNNDVEDCSYEPTGINAQFGYNTTNIDGTENMCCKQKDEMEQKMLEQIRCLKFAITDIAEYLNTHADDRKALCLHREYTNELKNLLDKYQRIYGPLSIYFPCCSWRWLEEPWPWEGGDF